MNKDTVFRGLPSRMRAQLAWEKTSGRSLLFLLKCPFSILHRMHIHPCFVWPALTEWDRGGHQLAWFQAAARLGDIRALRGGSVLAGELAQLDVVICRPHSGGEEPID